MSKSVTKETKQQWLDWIDNMLDHTNDDNIPKTPTNRVFLTDEDDKDIAEYVLMTFRETITANIH